MYLLNRKRIFLQGIVPAACALLMLVSTAVADEKSSTALIQKNFHQQYDHFLGPDSQSTLPIPRMEKAEWQKTIIDGHATRIFSEPDVFYNNKVYTFTLFRSNLDDRFYLDAKGGFWGMDEIFYGPIEGDQLR